MNLHENNDFGRKVFFVMPSYDFQSLVIPSLYEQEFEVYILDNFTKAKDILRSFPDSICFINTDEGLSPSEWFFYIKSFESDPMLSTIFLGIICTRMTKAQKEQFAIETTIPAGILESRVNNNELIERIVKILTINGAKGRRRYVRAKCDNDFLSFATFLINGNEVKIKINDISSAGVSCSTVSAYADFFTPKTLIRNFSLSLNNKKANCIGVVYLAHTQGEKLTFVILFTKNMAFTTRTFIKKYVHNRLQNQIEEKLQNCKVENAENFKVAESLENPKEEEILEEL